MPCRVDGTVWTKLTEPADRYHPHTVHLTIMPAKRGVRKRLVTLTDGGKPMYRDGSKWRKLTTADLLGRGDGLVLQPQDSLAYTK